MVSEARSYVWSKLEESGFLERVNHAVASDGKYMYSFGGFRGRGNLIGSTLENWNDLGEVPMDVMRLDIESGTWERLYPPEDINVPVPSCPLKQPINNSSTSKFALPGRYAHSCVCYKGCLYLYGGRSDERFFTSIECFDPATNKWSVIKARSEDGNLPTGRYAHACTSNGHIMYIQGGTTLTQNGRYLKYTQELLSFNFETLMWKKEPVLNDDSAYADLPLARDFHSGVYINQRIVIFGGKCPNDEDDDGFYDYNIGTNKWFRIDTVGYRPLGRRSLQGVPYGEKSIIYFGGFSTVQKYFFSDVFILNTDTKHVLRLKPYGLGPCPRRRPGMCLIKSDLIICGGVGRNQDVGSPHALMTFGDTHILHLMSSLEHLCKQAIIDYQLPLDKLPVSIQTHINELKSKQHNDAQYIGGEFFDVEDVRSQPFITL